MDHETFVSRAQQAGENAQRRCSLAYHVRELYADIRQLQKEGNSFLYIAEVLMKVRGGRTDPAAMAERIRVYHFRDRRDVGHEPIRRRLGSRLESKASDTTAKGEGTGAHALTSDAQIQMANDAADEAGQLTLVDASSNRPPGPAWMEQPGAAHEDLRATTLALSIEQEERQALTRSLHQRIGQRIVVRDS